MPERKKYDKRQRKYFISAIKRTEQIKIATLNIDNKYRYTEEELDIMNYFFGTGIYAKF